MDLCRRFGMNVKVARAAAGHTQEELADMAGVARSYMSDVERGVRNPTLMVVERIAQALDIDPAELLEAVKE
jgi:transcriptional regulator with XRE-family HTH domain